MYSFWGLFPVRSSRELEVYLRQERITNVLTKVCIMFAVVSASLAAAAGAFASNGKSDIPVPGASNCQGHLIAISNHSSGHGPGYYLHSDTHDAVTEYVQSYCD